MSARHIGALFSNAAVRPGRDQDELARPAIDEHVRVAAGLRGEIAFGHPGGAALAPGKAGQRGSDEKVTDGLHA